MTDLLCKRCGKNRPAYQPVICEDCCKSGWCVWCGEKPVMKGEKLILWSHACEDCYGK